MGENPFLRVLLMQMTSTDSIEANLDQIHYHLETISDLSSFDFISLPENSLYFYLSNRGVRFPGLHLSDSVFQDLQKYCDEFDLCLHVGSVPLADEGTMVNATVWLAPHRPPECVYRKIHLFDMEVDGHSPLRESDQFAPGRQPSTVRLRGWEIGLSICYDLRFSELYSQYARRGVDILLVPSAFTFTTGLAHWHCLLRARAIESQCFVIAAAQSGRHSKNRVTFGHSLVYGPWGEPLGEIKEEGPGILRVDLHPNLLNKARQQIPMSQHRRL